MGWISDDGLIEIANLNLDFASCVSDRTKIAHMAIAANPNLRPLGKRAAFHSFEPPIVANRIAPHVSMRGSGHFALANVFQARRATAGTGDTLFVFHDFFCPGYRCRQLERVASWPPLFVAFAYAAILVAAILSALLFAIWVSSFSAFISSCSVWLSSAAASGMPS
jgi:hypothetical protein